MNSFDLHEDDLDEDALLHALNSNAQVLLVTGGSDGRYRISSTEVSLSNGKSFGFGEIDKQNDLTLSA